MRKAWMLVGLLSGCAAHQGVSGEIQSGFTAASQRAQLAEEAVQELTDRLDALDEALRAGGGADAEALAAVQAEVAALRGSAEEATFAVQQVRADLDQYRIDQERRVLHAEARLAQVEQLLGVAPPPVPDLGVGTPTAPATTPPTTGPATPPTTSPDTAPPPTAPPATPPADAQTFDGRLSLAEQRMREGQQAAARAILEAAVQAQPNHARVAEAHYRIAETWFNEGAFRDAVRAFRVVTDRYEKSAWAPWAMLRIGESFDGLGRGDAADTFYDAVLRNFPNSDAASEAKSLKAR